MGWDDVIVERVFHVSGLVRPPIQSTEVGVVFGEKQFGSNNINFGVNFEVCRGTDRRRRWQAKQIGFTQRRVPHRNTADLVAAFH